MDRAEGLEVCVCPASWGCNPSLLPFVSNCGGSILIYSPSPEYPVACYRDEWRGDRAVAHRAKAGCLRLNSA